MLSFSFFNIPTTQLLKSGRKANLIEIKSVYHGSDATHPLARMDGECKI